eukprot:TRINITY_DN1629_c0_g2_i1.p1 TRINITY_DN1629_c0_g2~~TRINITY_DN1629_c0_g2_i1.p1  ORF type:complete len:354 (-),score=72.22 TRINITY_DN1629_c0_g2_i1:41-1102(-)
MEKAKKCKVLVTGSTGFVGSYITKCLIEKGYEVRGTVRSKTDEKKMRVLQQFPQDRLEVVEADLLKPESWNEAIKGCTMVAHVASLVIMFSAKDPELVVRTAKEGTMNVLRACASHKEVKAVVVTSSIAAIQSLGKQAKDEYTEEDWCNLESVPAYCIDGKGKTLAERAAWEFYDTLDKATRFKLSVINPGVILGPSLVATNFASGNFITQILTNQLSAIPWISLSLVDVRDVAAAHIAALESPLSGGQRYICVAGEGMWFEELVEVLREEFEKFGYVITKKKVKYCYAKSLAFVDSKVSEMLPYWGREFTFVNKKIKEQLGMKFIPAKESIIKMAYSLIEHGVIPNLINKKA